MVIAPPNKQNESKQCLHFNLEELPYSFLEPIISLLKLKFRAPGKLNHLSKKKELFQINLHMELCRAMQYIHTQVGQIHNFHYIYKLVKSNNKF